MGGARRLFNTDSFVLYYENETTVWDILEHLKAELSKKLEQNNAAQHPQNGPDLEGDFIIAVNGVDCNAIKGYDTKIKKDDTITLLPIVHGGQDKNKQSLQLQ